MSAIAELEKMELLQPIKRGEPAWNIALLYPRRASGRRQRTWHSTPTG